MRIRIHENGKSRVVPISKAETTVGRGAEADVRLAENRISRVHAMIAFRNGKLEILDGQTLNGTFVNGRRIGAVPVVLTVGDEIRIGNAILSVEPQPERQPQAGLVSKLAVLALFVCGAALVVGIVGRTRVQPLPSPRVPFRHAAPETPAETPSVIESVPVAPTEPEPLETSAPSFPPPPTLGTRAGGFGTGRYLDMSEEEKARFVEAQARRVSRMIGNRECSFDAEVVQLIKRYVDGYARRGANRSTKLWGENLDSMYSRAAREYAPHINRSFLSEGVPPVIGLYLAAIESEYHECLNSPVGAQGMFQFMPDTARVYGLDPAKRCDWRLAAPAAARYMKDRLNQFGPDAQSVALAIAGYNRGPGSVLRDLEAVLNDRNRERSFWTLAANAEQLDHYFQNENVRYVPKFFAAAIVGETPWAFGLGLQPLSTYR